MKTVKNRWIILTAGVCIQIILGGIYAWSTFTPYLLDDYSLTKGASGLIFGTTIITFTIAMIFAGHILKDRGPKITAGIGALLFGTGYIVASFSNGSFPLLLAGIGVLSGAGIGFGYVCPLSTGMQWFPAHKGLVTGVAVAGFGGGAVLLSAIANSFLGEMDVLTFFRFYGIAAIVILLAASALIAFPDSPPGTDSKTLEAPLFSSAFLLASAGLFAGTFAGLMIIGNLSLIIQNAGFDATAVVFSISFFSIGNALGRLGWGVLYDKFKHICMPLSLFSLAVPCMLLLLPMPSIIMYAVVLWLGLGFGANFVVYAGAISDYFGVNVFSRVYPVCFLAYGIAGLIGPGTGGLIADATGTYFIAIVLSTCLLVITALLLLLRLSVFKTGIKGFEYRRISRNQH